jgi:hypothetical protein
MSPTSGPTNRTPSALRVVRFLWVAGWFHIRTFMAGTISTGVSVARRRVVARSFARPAAARAIRSAVAGATTMRSAERDSRICPISASSVREKRSVWTLSSHRAARERGVTNLDPASVRTGRTAMPRPRSRRTSSRHL